MSPATVEISVPAPEYMISYDEITRCLLLGLDDLRNKLELARAAQREAQVARIAPPAVTTARLKERRAKPAAPCWFYATEALLA